MIDWIMLKSYVHVLPLVLQYRCYRPLLANGSFFKVIRMSICHYYCMWNAKYKTWDVFQYNGSGLVANEGDSTMSKHSSTLMYFFHVPTPFSWTFKPSIFAFPRFFLLKVAPCTQGINKQMQNQIFNFGKWRKPMKMIPWRKNKSIINIIMFSNYY